MTGAHATSLSVYAGSVAGDVGLAAQPGREEECRTLLSRAIDYANALKCPRY